MKTVLQQMQDVRRNFVVGSVEWHAMNLAIAAHIGSEMNVFVDIEYLDEAIAKKYLNVTKAMEQIS